MKTLNQLFNQPLGYSLLVAHSMVSYEGEEFRFVSRRLLRRWWQCDDQQLLPRNYAYNRNVKEVQS